MTAILDFCVANVIFRNNDPKGVYMPILVLVSLIGQLCPKHVIICPTIWRSCKKSSSVLFSKISFGRRLCSNFAKAKSGAPIGISGILSLEVELSFYA